METIIYESSILVRQNWQLRCVEFQLSSHGNNVDELHAKQGNSAIAVGFATSIVYRC